MSTETLRAVGGSVMMAVPKRYTLAELVAQCDPSLPLSKEEQEWLDAPAVGLEADVVWGYQSE